MNEQSKIKHSNLPRKPDKSGAGSAQPVLISLVAGIVAGIFFGDMAGSLQVIGDIFIKLLQITVIPYISLALITGLGSLKKDEVAGLARIGGTILLLVWFIASMIVVLAPLAFPDWPTSAYFSLSLTEAASSPDFLRLFIPSNPFYAYANALVPAVVVFSILVGIALINIDEKESFIGPLKVLRDALMKVTSIISKLAPVGVFALMASTMGTIDLDDLTRLQIYIVCYAFFAMILALWVLPSLVAALTPLRYREILRALRTPLVTAFATGSSLIVLPLLIDQCRQLLADSQQFGSEESEKSERADSLVKVLIPTAYPFLSPAAILMLIYVLFGGWYTGSAIEVASYLKIFLAGIPSLFAGPFIAMPFLLDLLKLPQDLFPIFVSMDVITVRFGTLLSAMHYSAIALIGTFFLTSKQRVQWRALVRLTAVSVVLIAVFLLGARGFYTYVVTPTYTKANVMRGLQLREEAQPSMVHNTSTASIPDGTKKLATRADIIERGILRVCFQPNEYPSAFYTSATPPELVGFDIEMAHLLAKQYQARLEFFPAADESEAAELLNTGICDIYMRTMPITAGRTEKFNLTLPIYTSSVGVIVKDYRRREFENWDALRTAGSKLRVAADSDKQTQFSIKGLLPDAQLFPIEDMDGQASILESKSDDIDAVIDMAEEGAAWSVIYPHYSVVVPKPTVFIPVGYAVAKGNDELLAAVNAGLMLAQANGVIDTNYDYWMLGGAAKSERPPRWSIIKDVLKWVD